MESKIVQHFIFTTTPIGRNGEYRITVYEIVKGHAELVDSAKRNYGAHCGEESEAWQMCFHKVKKHLKNAIAENSFKTERNYTMYYSWMYQRAVLGINVQKIGE